MPRWLLAILALAGLVLVLGGTAVALAGDDAPILRAGAQPKEGDEQSEERLLDLDLATTSARLAGDNPLDRTWIHPESYPTTQRLLGELGYDRGEIARLAERHVVQL